jgi:hypothetical protein
MILGLNVTLWRILLTVDLLPQLESLSRLGRFQKHAANATFLLDFLVKLRLLTFTELVLKYVKKRLFRSLNLNAKGMVFRHVVSRLNALVDEVSFAALLKKRFSRPNVFDGLQEST